MTKKTNEQYHHKKDQNKERQQRRRHWKLKLKQMRLRKALRQYRLHLPKQKRHQWKRHQRRRTWRRLGTWFPVTTRRRK